MRDDQRPCQACCSVVFASGAACSGQIFARRYSKACHEGTMELANLIKELLVEGV